jgi:hypothetical protein
MTIIVFQKDTPQSTIDWHVRRKNARMYYDGVPPKWEAKAIAEDWSFPYVVPQADVEGVE